jgi:xanthine dehydrogenase YagS FAD-binding subunit
MTQFSYTIARNEDRAFSAWAGNPNAMYVAGATDVMQLLQEDIVAPETLIDISRLPLTKQRFVGWPTERSCVRG